MDSSKLKFSIITPAYNRGKFLHTCINSVLMQEYSNWELILVDDGSTDNTMDVVNSFNDERIMYYRKENEERSIARNFGIKKASGDYLLFLDSDDFLPSDTLLKIAISIHENAPHKEVIVSVSNRFIKNGELEITKTSLESGDTAKAILNRHGVITVNQCAHRSCFENNLFDERFTLWEDTHLWLRLIQQYPIINSKAEVHCVVHDESGVQMGFSNLNLSYVERYKNAVLSLLEYKSLFDKAQFEKLMKSYIFNKYQMFFYMARLNKQWDIASRILDDSRKFEFDFSYFVRSKINLLFKR